MFCPRCGRPVNEHANFCGGCGLPRAEIEKSINEKMKQMQTPAVSPAPTIDPVNVDELHSTIEKLEGDLSGINPVVDYTTEQTEDTNTINTPSDFIQQEIKEEQLKAEKEGTSSYFGQSDYSRNAPQYPNHSYSDNNTGAYINYVNPEMAQAEPETNDITLSTVDYIWMMLISSIPVVGLIYLLWLGFIQKDNPNKTSFARAVLIISVFAFILSMVFAMGLIITQLSMFY